MGKREDNRVRTLTQLANAAIDLFMERGFEAVTMAEVAEAAGVSRRTAYRHFRNKADLVMYHPQSWLGVFGRATEQYADLPLGERLRAASHAIADHIESDPEPVRKAFAVAGSHPVLASANAVTGARWVETVAEEISSDMPSTPDSAVRSRIVAAAVMGMIDKVCVIWAEGDDPMNPLIDTGFDLLSSTIDAVVES